VPVILGGFAVSHQGTEVRGCTAVKSLEVLGKAPGLIKLLQVCILTRAGGVSSDSVVFVFGVFLSGGWLAVLSGGSVSMCVNMCKAVPSRKDSFHLSTFDVTAATCMLAGSQGQRSRQAGAGAVAGC
jgi:hypothetical protein